MSEKLCIACKWVAKEDGTDELAYRCTKFVVKSQVTGEPKYPFCRSKRSIYDVDCADSGRGWEKRND